MGSNNRNSVVVLSNNKWEKKVRSRPYRPIYVPVDDYYDSLVVNPCGREIIAILHN